MTTGQERQHPPGPRLNRLVATYICNQTGGAPDEAYPAYSTDIGLAFRAADAFAAIHREVSLQVEYPMPEVWVRRQSSEFGAGWFPAAYVCGDSLPACICTALLRAAGVLDSNGVLAVAD